MNIFVLLLWGLLIVVIIYHFPGFKKKKTNIPIETKRIECANVLFGGDETVDVFVNNEKKTVKIVLKYPDNQEIILMNNNPTFKVGE